MALSNYRLGRRGGKPDFFLATTCASGRPCANYVMSLTDSTAFLAENGIAFDYWLHCEDCHVDDARNFLVQEFLATEAPYMVFIDDDVGFTTEALAKLISFKDADIVGGAYPLKQDIEDYPTRIRADVPVMQAREDGLLEVEGVPTGFMRISRKVLETLSEKRKHMYYVPTGAQADDRRCQVIFERMMVNGKRWSGDLNFCREARQAGFKVFVDPEMEFSHQGNKRWDGHLGNWLRKTQGILDPRLDEAMQRLMTGDNSPEVFNAIVAYNHNPFSACAEMLSAAYDHALKATRPIIEVGTGLTTLVMGIACLRNGQRVHALEHDLEYFRQMRRSIELWGLRPISLYYAPLKEYPEITPEGAKQPLMWYGDIDDLPKEADLVVIDGPPRRYGREAGYKLLKRQLMIAKTWIVDDVDDPGELARVTKYATEYLKTVQDVGLKQRGRRRYAVAT